MTTLRLYFAPWNAHRQISWTFHIQVLYIKIYITHSAKIIYIIYIHYLQTSVFSPELSKHCSRNLPSLNLTALRAVLRITAPRAGMSNYVNKQIPLKTGLASYLVSKLHGSEVRNCRDQRVFFSHSSPLNFCRKQQEKKNFWHPGYTISCYSRGLRSTKTLKESNRTPFSCNGQHTWLEILVVMMEK